MQTLILAGGLGTRLRPVVDNLPKVMAPIGTERYPFLQYLLDYWIDQGITHIVLAVGYQKEKIIDFFGDVYKNIPITYVIETELLGTGGAILNALTVLDDEFLLLNGDSICYQSLEQLILTHRKNQAALTLTLREVEKSDRYGSVMLENQSNKILSFLEKQQNKTAQGNTLINAGCYLLSKNALQTIFGHLIGKICSFEQDICPILVSYGKVYGVICPEFFIDIGIPNDYLKFDKKISENL